MGLYERHIGPRIVRCLCGMRDIADQRREVLPHAAGTVVEIGIGPGLNLPFYDPARVTRVIGVDPNDGFLRLASKNKPAIPLDILRAPAEAIPLPDASCDTAVVTYTLCSVADPLQALRELRRVLRPQGRVLFCEHGRSPEPGVARWQDRLNPLWRRLAVGCNLNRPVRGLFDAAGFRIETLREFYLDKTPRPVGFHSRGIAVPA